MPVDDRRRAVLRRAASTSWGEAAANTLMELVTPAGQDPATRGDLQGVLAAPVSRTTDDDTVDPPTFGIVPVGACSGDRTQP